MHRLVSAVWTDRKTSLRRPRRRGKCRRRNGEETMADRAEPAERLTQAEIVIIGCGPVGAMLANLLGLQGIRTMVLEREAAIFDLPRAVHFDDDVMRLLQTVGLTDAMRPMVHVSPGMKF